MNVESLVDMGAIRAYCDQIANEFHPDRIILFGSYAYGNPTPDSDVDLLVVLPFNGKSVEKALEIRLRVKSSFPLDLLVRTPEMMRERFEQEDFFMREIVEKGKVLYENHDD